MPKSPLGETFDKCPNCGTESPLRKVYDCENGHLFCEMCEGTGRYGVLRMPYPICPTCQCEAQELVGFIKWDMTKEEPKG